MVRLRAETNGKVYIQELVNRFFEDTEERIRLHGVSSLLQTVNIDGDY
jgi:cytochrome b pre-mRNA-processing protein 3